MLQTAITAVKEAAAITTKYFAKPSNVRYKDGEELVTNVDIMSEKRIRAVLSAKFPDYDFLGEESGKQSSRSKYLWIADPIEGTVNYSRGIPTYCISLALAFKDTVVLGVIYNPITDELFTAEKGKNAFMNGKTIHVSAHSDLYQSVIYATELYKSAHYLKPLFNKVKNLRIASSSAYDNCLVGCGRTEAFIKITTHPWGFAAADVIVEEAGGQVTNFDGSAWDITSTKLLASNGVLHQEILALLEKAPLLNTE